MHTILSLIFMLSPIILVIYLRRRRSRVSKILRDPANLIRAAEDPEKTYHFYVPPSMSMKHRRVFGISVKTDIPFKLRIERKGRLTRLAVLLGFATPVPTGDAVFDRQLYVYSTNQAFYDLLAGNASFRSTILTLFGVGAISIIVAHGQLVAMCPRLHKKFDKEPDEETAEGMGELLHTLRRQIATIATVAQPPHFARAERITRVCKSGMSWLLLASLFLPYMLGGSLMERVEDTDAIIHLSYLSTLPLVLAILLFFRISVGSTPYGADMFRSFIIFGVVTVFATAFDTLYMADIHLDNSPGTEHLQPVAAKYEQSGRHPKYYVVVNDWHGAGRKRLDVSKPLFEQLSPGQTIRVITHPGLFNIEWMTIP